MKIPLLGKVSLFGNTEKVYRSISGSTVLFNESLDPDLIVLVNSLYKAEYEFQNSNFGGKWY